MKEQVIQAKIQKYIKAIGGYVIKTVTSNRAGIPDLLCCVRGRFIGIEVKAHKNKPTPLQLANITMIEAAGGLGLVVYNVEEVKNYLKTYL